MEEKRIIKKYPNRRLYDTEESKYITLEDIRNLVLNNKEFMVKDVKTDEDCKKYFGSIIFFLVLVNPVPE